MPFFLKKKSITFSFSSGRGARVFCFYSTSRFGGSWSLRRSLPLHLEAASARGPRRSPQSFALSLRSMARKTHRSLPTFFFFLLLLLLLISPLLSTTCKQRESRSSSDDDGEDLTGSALIDWIRASGGHSDVRVGLVADAPAGAEPTSTKTKRKKKKKRRRVKKGNSKSKSSALRGTIATRDLAAGEVIIRLPSNISVPLGGTGVTSPVREFFLFFVFLLSLSFLFAPHFIVAVRLFKTPTKRTPLFFSHFFSALSRSNRIRIRNTTFVTTGKRRPAPCSPRGRPDVVSRARALLGLAPFVGLHQGDVQAGAF